MHDNRLQQVEKTRLLLIQRVHQFDQPNTTGVVWPKLWIGKRWNGNLGPTILFILGKFIRNPGCQKSFMIQSSRLWNRIARGCGLYRWWTWRSNTNRWRLLLPCYDHCKVWEQCLVKNWRFELRSSVKYCDHARKRYGGIWRHNYRLWFRLWVNFNI